MSTQIARTGESPGAIRVLRDSMLGAAWHRSVVYRPGAREERLARAAVWVKRLGVPSEGASTVCEASLPRRDGTARSARP